MKRILLFIFLECSLALYIEPIKNTTTRYGQDQVAIQNLLSEIFGQIRYQSLQYNPDFRPPSLSNEATLVQISFRGLKVVEFNEVDQTIKLDLFLFREYNDSRLVYKTQDGIKDLSLKHSGSVWVPQVEFPNAINAVLTATQFTNGFLQSVTLVSPEGQVLIKSATTLTLKRTLNQHEKEFKTKIVSGVNTLDQVKLIWKEENPVSFTDNEFMSIVTGTTYSLEHIVGMCKHTEDYGGFGIKEFPCIEFTLRLKNNN